MIERLRACNGALRIHSVTDAVFAPYGRILPLRDASLLRRALAETPIPEEGNRYVASLDTLEAACEAAGALAPFGGMETQAGYCNGRGHRLNALEYHKCSEVNFSDTGLVLLLALPEDVTDGRLDSSAVRAFYLPPDVAVEIFPRVLHFAPCRVAEDGFRCLVVLERGVNSPIELPGEEAGGEERMLWMRGKWMLCHPDSPQAEKGAYVGIDGENIDLKI